MEKLQIYINDMWLIVGLGNPGDEYALTRHNAGFMAVDNIAEAFKAGAFRCKFHAEYSTIEHKGIKAILLKPQTYMNLSGRSVQECASFYKIPLENIIVIHDDVDLETGRIKAKIGGSNGGHNGLKSIDAAISPEYLRVRVGVSRPIAEWDVADYVLGRFANEEMEVVEKALGNISANLKLLIAGDLSKFMNNCVINNMQMHSKKS